MSAPSHTSGPWKACQGREHEPERWIVVSAGRVQWHIAIVENGQPGDTCETEGHTARLIAAAPDLFDALADLLCNVEVPAKNCSCHLSPPCNDCLDYGALRECIEAGHAAIAKATGGGAQ